MGGVLKGPWIDPLNTRRNGKDFFFRIAGVCVKDGSGAVVYRFRQPLAQVKRGTGYLADAVRQDDLVQITAGKRKGLNGLDALIQKDALQILAVGESPLLDALHHAGDPDAAKPVTFIERHPTDHGRSGRDHRVAQKIHPCIFVQQYTHVVPSHKWRSLSPAILIAAPQVIVFTKALYTIQYNVSLVILQDLTKITYGPCHLIPRIIGF